MISLEGKVVLVTGGAHRVGKAIALALAAEKMQVLITYHNSQEQAQETVEEISKISMPSMAFQCDQTDNYQISQVMDEISNRYGRLDALVNCASIMQEVPFTEVTQEMWDAGMADNVRGPFFFSHMAAGLMMGGESGSGVIINLLDEPAVSPTKYFVHHSATKAALHMLTRSMALALAPQIRVNAVLPGPVLMPEGGDVEKWQRLEKNTPLKRLGTPESVTRAVIYIMKEAFMTGQVITVDGGRTIK